MDGYKVIYWISQILFGLSFVFSLIIMVLVNLILPQTTTTEEMFNILNLATRVNFISILLLFGAIFLLNIQMAILAPVTEYTLQLKKMGRTNGRILGTILVWFLFSFIVLFLEIDGMTFLTIGVIPALAFITYLAATLILALKQNPNTTDEKNIQTGLKGIVYGFLIYVLLLISNLFFSVIGGFIGVVSLLGMGIWIGLHMYSNYQIYRYNRQNIQTNNQNIELYTQYGDHIAN